MLDLNAGSRDHSWLPSFDLHEEDGELILHADLRGFDNEDVEVSLDGGDLIVQAESENPQDTPVWYSRLPLPFALRSLPAVSRSSREILEVRIPIPEM
jgi:HSP20 family molecular chaperone IbpA